MKIKTDQLTGAALDWAVAKCEGEDDYLAIWRKLQRADYFAPSTNWAQGGPIIERERLSVVIQVGGDNPVWHSSCPRYLCHGYAPTPLIAAMRCYVASKLGDEVDVPIEIADPHHPDCPAVDGFGCHCDELTNPLKVVPTPQGDAFIIHHNND